MDHLFNSRVQVQRLAMTTRDGVADHDWVNQPAPLNYVACRLDMDFLRPGKDVPMAAEAGKAPDRIGILFCRADSGIRAGDRLVAVLNTRGKLPVPGTFDVKPIPDMPQDYADAHHIEVQIVEVAQAVAAGIRRFPGGDGVGV